MDHQPTELTPTSEKHMENTRLIQRLEKPAGELNPFSFGGGYKNGGLSDKGADLIKKVFSFDYMGAAEFEFGAVPKALSAMHETEDKVAFSLEVKGSDVNYRWEPRQEPDFPEKSTIYVLCSAKDKEEVEALIRKIASDEASLRLKEATCLQRALDNNADSYRVCGWLELDNGFFFCTDKNMWECTCALFGAETNA
jgi:hypothetical protein